MSNHISYDACPDLPDIGMSNGLTSVVVGVLALAMSALAERRQEQRFAAWIASHDQGAIGGGMVGFDVAEMPWDPASFERDRAFVLAAIDAALARRDWNRLGYEPREEFVFDSLRRFRAMVERFAAAHVEPAASWTWGWSEEPHELTACTIHGVYLHEMGCVICNDA